MRGKSSRCFVAVDGSLAPTEQILIPKCKHTCAESDTIIVCACTATTRHRSEGAEKRGARDTEIIGGRGTAALGERLRPLQLLIGDGPCGVRVRLSTVNVQIPLFVHRNASLTSLIGHIVTARNEGKVEIQSEAQNQHSEAQGKGHWIPLVASADRSAAPQEEGIR